MPTLKKQVAWNTQSETGYFILLYSNVFFCSISYQGYLSWMEMLFIDILSN